MTSGYVDGVVFLYESQWGPIWSMARGYTHTDRLIVGEPYRTPTCRTAAVRLQREYLPCIGRRVTVFRRDKIVAKLDPYRALSRLPARLLSTVSDFMERLGAAWYGITGSWAVSCNRDDSDVDILVFYEKGMISALRDLYREGLISQCKEELVVSKRRDRRDIGLDKSMIRSSLLDSCYRGVPYTLRLLAYWGEKPCTGVRAYLGLARATLIIEGGGFTVPARYVSRVIDSRPPSLAGTRVVLETWRTRYQELPPGTYIVEGELFLEGDTLVLSPDLEGMIVRA